MPELTHLNRAGEAEMVDISAKETSVRQAAKKCSDLIPLCHPLPLSSVSIDLQIEPGLVRIRASCKTTGKTGGEMEALTAASVAALTIYDMCKALDKGIEIKSTRLLQKTGGKSGDWGIEA